MQSQVQMRVKMQVLANHPLFSRLPQAQSRKRHALAFEKTGDGLARTIQMQIDMQMQVQMQVQT